ncbi:hypothetical protein AB0J83_17635 [Actinoplanes sp. NPDC049596]|uniref:hypothetical protein n=1 Tax=unclassified Actinoplanes TaxID=2626549 RepID=UPI00343A4623
MRRGRYDVAGDIAAAMHDRARVTGERRLEKLPFHVMASIARLSGDLPAARRAFEESVALHSELSDAAGVAMEQLNLTHVELDLGNVARARQLFDASRRYLVAAGDSASLLPALALLSAVLAEHDGQVTTAARRLGAVDESMTAVGKVLDPDDALVRDGLSERLAVAMGGSGLRHRLR